MSQERKDKSMKQSRNNVPFPCESMLVSDNSDDDKAQSININVVIPKKKGPNRPNISEEYDHSNQVQHHLQQKIKMPELRYNAEKSANHLTAAFDLPQSTNLPYNNSNKPY